MTLEARATVAAADELLYLVPDPVFASWLEGLNPRARSLHPLYRTGVERTEIYAAIVDEIVGRVRAGADVCAAFYGHAGVFAFPSHEAIRRVRAEGLQARMLPGVSAEDCLFADLGVDPGAHGCQSHEATTFLVERRPVDTAAALLLWQISAIGESAYAPEPGFGGLDALVERLREDYPAMHEVVVYEASPYPVAGPIVTRTALAKLDAAHVTPLATLYVPPLPAGTDP
jgi:uncharacterized protein YabN with tetrapyrrole methylase and pyrophosphatase domain